MKRANILAMLVFVIALPAAKQAQQASPSPAPPSHWVPFTAKLNEFYATFTPGAQVGGGRFRVVQIEGLLAQNDSGATYEYWSQPLSPVASLPNVSYLFDRTARERWEIDYRLKNVRRSVLPMKGHPELGGVPMSWDDFRKLHASDEALGPRVVSNIECLEYRISDSGNRLKMYHEEVCFAPSLNFNPIKYHHMYPGGRDVKMQAMEVQIGSPDPKLFRLPEGFTAVH